MLGKFFKVVIDGSAYGANSKYCPPLYTAHIVDPLRGFFNKKVYFISNQPVEKSVVGKVIAIVNRGKPYEKLILAPKSAIYYSPEIRNRLSRIKNQPPYRLNCLYEKSCGAIIFNDLSDERYFLLVKNTNGKYWGFPKGHVEIGETEEQTAIREVKEETNLDVTILPGFRKTSIYRLFDQIKKQVVIFVAKTNSKKVIAQNTEIEKFKWLKKDDIFKYLSHRNDLKNFEEAVKWLEKNKFVNK